MSDSPLSSYLRMLREKGGYTQDDIAKVVGVSRANYSHYENARIMPSNDCLCKIADFYHVSLSKLIRLSGTNYVVDDADDMKDSDESAGFFAATKSDSYEKIYNDFLKECADMRPEDLAKWLSIEDRELVYNFHKLSSREKRLITYLIKLMLVSNINP